MTHRNQRNLGRQSWPKESVPSPSTPSALVTGSWWSENPAPIGQISQRQPDSWNLAAKKRRQKTLDPPTPWSLSFPQGEIARANSRTGAAGK
jgi:hypothetical protein